MKRYSYNLSLLSKYRSALMGMATIGILMCHAPANGVNLPFHLNSILELGAVGSDGFLLRIRSWSVLFYKADGV